MQTQYAVYVKDANGWDEGCPDSESVFFGDHGGKFFRHGFDEEAPAGAASLDLGTQGFVVVTGHRAAVALRNELERTGNWVAPEEVNPTGATSRPSYAIRKLEATR
jgi:hypothetical protein